MCGDAGYYVEKGNGVSSGAKYARVISEALSNRELAAQRVAAGLHRAEEFSIENCAKKTWHVYEKVLGLTPVRFAGEPAEAPQHIHA